MANEIITPRLLEVIRAQFPLDWNGIHGAAHWARVRANGLRIARDNGADATVVELFAFLHDARRYDDGLDAEHGARAAAFAEELSGRHFHVSARQLGLLMEACRDHSNGRTAADPTVQTCWDADRLDLGRVGIRPDPSRLCTEVAREPAMIAWAYERSVNGSPWHSRRRRGRRGRRRR